MGRKRRKAASKEDIKPFCYYCGRSFENEGILIQHQKAQHFRCPECKRKMVTVHALVNHMFQVHKTTIKSVPKAKPDRDSLEVSILGMSGVPHDMIEERRRRQAAEAAKKQKTEESDDDEGAEEGKKKSKTKPSPHFIEPGSTPGYGPVSAKPAAPQPMPYPGPPGQYTMPPRTGAPPTAPGFPPAAAPPMPGYPPSPYGLPPHGFPAPFPPAPGYPPSSYGPPAHPSPYAAPPFAPFAPTQPGHPAPAATPPAAPTPPAHGGANDDKSGTVYVYKDENESMEEKRARLPRYQFDDASAMREDLTRLSASIAARMTALQQPGPGSVQPV